MLNSPAVLCILESGIFQQMKENKLKGRQEMQSGIEGNNQTLIA